MNLNFLQIKPLTLSLIVGVNGLVLENTALASDGVREINQACVADGCFPGDDPGFPIEITATGSYVLSSNIDVRNEPTPENVTAIDISAFEFPVTLDLNGFSVIGPTICSGGIPVTMCDSTGTGIGIKSSNFVTIRHGAIVGMGDRGAWLGTASRVEKIQFRWNGGDGLLIGDHSTVLDSVFFGNGAAGIHTSGYVRLLNNTAVGNLGLGIDSGGTTVYGLNSINLNGGGTIDFGIQISSNQCDGDLDCP